MGRFLLSVFALAIFGAALLYYAGDTQHAWWLAAVAVVALVLWIQFLPTFVAYRREHPNRLPILLLNLFLGWTLIGWVAALVWAYIALPTPEPVRGFADR